ncbi:hypothetical protein [Streptomyces sp. enrichment culture]|uniref:hypothetical protein n=1 Tax=Streptomyces sp. enrichment culture TaxID=1795815 RepID=UPI003F55BDE6
MSTPVPPSRRRHVSAPGAAAPRQPVDQAKVGRRAVRRRAAGMTATEAAAALEDARLQQHLDRDREDLAGNERGPAEVAEWERIALLLATTGGVYDPETDAVVQDELAADRRAAQAEQQRLKAQQQAARADELATLAGAGRPTGPWTAARRRAPALRRRGPLPLPEGRQLAAAALADDSGHYADPAARTAAVGSLPSPVRARAALLPHSPAPTPEPATASWSARRVSPRPTRPLPTRSPPRLDRALG